MVVAYVFLTVKRGGENTVANMLSKMEDVRDVAELYGEYDVIAKIEKPSMEELQKFLVRDIRKINGVDKTSTMIATDEKQ
ncbi:MAG TPA: Lrp/AsnC family transcriptional regulator [Candidatus Woesearchaeota archaeon]|nr:Lrp/AsnC family transcriptional regulator [Candidatus Woesearchaeota archaeon]